jgi:hypothetical protein
MAGIDPDPPLGWAFYARISPFLKNQADERLAL